MDLSQIGITEKKGKQFSAAGINTAEDLIYFFPKDYIDRTTQTGLLVDQREESRLIVYLEQCGYHNSRVSFIEARGCLVSDPNIKIRIIWWNTYIWDQVKMLQNRQIYLCGKVKSIPAWSNSHESWYDIQNPAVFDPDIQSAMRIYPVYKNIRGMSADYHMQKLQAAYSALTPVEEPLPEDVLVKHDLVSYTQMIYSLHWPESSEMLEKAQKRRRWNDLFYFASRMELDMLHMPQGSPFHFPLLQKYRQALNSLPFRLTPDQEKTVNDILNHIQHGKRCNALVQGDVGSGKSIVAFLLMIACAENGHQAALMAPTQILAAQHYEKLRELAEPLGMEVAYVASGRLRVAERKALQDKLASGRIRLIVGTQALLSQGVYYNKLALCITDEEHRYGVNQRNTLAQKAADGTHIISMTATPIPRSLATTVYGSHVELYSIKTKPPGRQPVLTGIPTDMNAVYQYIYDIVHMNQQAYVVCPMIEANEKMEGVESVDSVYQMYQQALAPYGIRIGIVTGKMKKEDAAKTIEAFSAGDLHVLIATTVIEVGVDNPNATCIVIHNAERFGLAQLHQLRGRVGRNSLQSICCLVSEFRDSPRLQAMCRTTDGFEIAEEDLRLRGAGDLLGTAQSGRERYLTLALTHPQEFTDARYAASRMIRYGKTCALLDQAMTDRANGKEGDILA